MWMGPRTGIAVGASVLALALVPAPAGAVTRYASVNGSTTHPTCDSAHPCTLVHAVQQAGDSDEVVVRAGTHTLSNPIATSKSLFIHGDFNASRPKILFGASAVPALTLTGGKLEHVSVEQTANGRTLSARDLDLRDVIAIGHIVAGAMVSYTHGGVIRDSAFLATGEASSAFASYGGDVKLRNVTAWNTGVNSIGLTGSSDATEGTGSLEARNTIAHGAYADIAVRSESGFASIVTVRHDNFAKVTYFGGNTSLNDLGNNQSAAPQLVDPANGNFHQSAASPTVNAGSTAGFPSLGPTDLDGDQRIVGSAPDIGADERTPPPAVVTGAANSIGSTVATITGTVNPQGGATTHSFQWGLTTAYGNPVFILFPSPTGNGTAPVPLSLKLTGLKPSTTYHYRLRAANTAGSTLGGDATFKTGPVGTPDPGGSGPNPGEPGGATLLVTGVSVKPARFRVAAGRTALSARRRPVPRGTTFAYTLNEPATVKIAIRRKLAGRRRGKRCVKPTRSLRRAKRCTRLGTKGTLTRQGKLGANSVRFTGRIGRRKLAPGRYAALISATDAAGNRSKPVTLGFTILPG
jgi:hypothetical protein